MKKIIALTLCLLMVFGMVACGNTAAPNAVEQEKEELAAAGKDAAAEAQIRTGSGTAQAEAMANGERPYEGQTLVVWTGFEQGTEVLEVADAWIARFEELSGADIQVVHRGRDLQTLLYPALDAGEKIDVFQVGSTIQLGLQKDHALDLTDYIEGSDIADRAYPVLMKQILDYGEDGNYYAIPTLSSMNAWWYNQDIFDEAGITEVPTTIEEFEACCDAIVEAGYYPMAADTAYSTGTVGPLVGRMVGEDIVAKMTIEGGFAENEDFVAACQKIIDWRNKGYFEPEAPGVWPASQNRIGLMKDTAMVYTGSWVTAEVEAACEEKLNWGSFPYPVDANSKNGTEGVAVSCTCVMINEECEVPDLAWDYMYFMYTADADKAITDVNNYLIDDRTMDPLPKFEGTQDAMETAADYVDGSGCLHANVDIKTSVNEVCTNLLSGKYATGLEAAKAFDALVQ